MRRRDFLAYGSASALLALYLQNQDAVAQKSSPGVVAAELHLEEIYEELIDGEVVFALAFRDPVTRIIRPPLRARQGDTVRIKLVNKTRVPRRFAITGVSAASSALIPAGRSATVRFTAPVGGSYIYHDNSQGAVGRVLGLHGPFVVLPKNGKTLAGSETPYSKARLTTAASAVFDALGKTARFPGDPWLPNLASRERIWLMSQIDPAINRAAEQNQAIDQYGLRNQFKPRYFTLNGLSGYDSSHDAATVPEGYVGEPCLVRTMNAGLNTHGPHIHGNHVFLLSDTLVDGKVAVNTNVLELDTWMLKAMDRKDILLPFERPQEIPLAAWPPREEPWPLLYPMHCHIEMSQTAGGGNYPQGIVTHWGLLGASREGA